MEEGDFIFVDFQFLKDWNMIKSVPIRWNDEKDLGFDPMENLAVYFHYDSLIKDYGDRKA